MDIKKHYFPQLDIAKFILSLFIVAIHAKLSSVLYPWLATAVPLFFIISSYLFFSKLENNNDACRLVKYVKRQMFLYLFYFILVSPIIIYQKKATYFSGAVGILHFFQDLFLGSTFPNSWFITASIIGTIIVFFLSKIWKPLPLIIGILLYIVCLLNQSYSFLLSGNILKNIFNPDFFYPTNSFFVSVIYISIGKIIANSKHKINVKIAGLCSIIFAILLFSEYRIVYSKTNITHFAAYIFLVPLCCFLFELILCINVPDGFLSKKMLIFARNSSIIIFGTHVVIMNLLNKIGIKYGAEMFFVALSISIIVSVVILFLEKYRLFSVLKYSH